MSTGGSFGKVNQPILIHEVLLERTKETGLADSGRSGDGQKGGAIGLKPVDDPSQFSVPPHHVGGGTGGPIMRFLMFLLLLGHVGLDRGVPALHPDRTQLTVPDLIMGEFLHGTGHKHRVGFGRLLQLLCHVHRIAHGGHVLPRHLAPDHFAPINSDAQGEVRGVSFAPFFPGLNFLHHLKTGPNRTQGIVLVGLRGPEERHDRVADVFVHVSAVCLHDVPQPLQNRIDGFLHLLRIAVLRVRGEPGKVREQYR